jgi:hypothetical protein
MTSIFSKFAIAAAVTLGAFGVTSQANAGSVDVIVKTPRVVVSPRVVVRPAPVVVVKPGYGRCQAGIALAKASRNGLNRVAISHVGPNRVTVTGKIRGAWAKMSFANVRGCPRL